MLQIEIPSWNETLRSVVIMETEEEASGQMTDEIYTNGVDDESLSQKQQRRLIISGEQLDIDAYAALYTGRTKISRLIFIAEKCGNVSMQLEALRMAYDDIKKGENTQMFREVVQKNRWTIGSELQFGFGLDGRGGP